MKYLVTVKPGTSQEKIVENFQPTQAEYPELTIWIRAKAHDGEANAAVIKLLSKYFHVPKTSVEILRGTTSRHKLISLPASDKA